MEGLEMNERCKLIYGKDNKTGALLHYSFTEKDAPFSIIDYWENNKEYKKWTLKFNSEIYGKDKIEQYWKQISELDKNKKLTMNTLCDIVETFFVKELTLEALRDKNRPKATWMHYPKHMLKYAITKTFKK